MRNPELLIESLGGDLKLSGKPVWRPIQSISETAVQLRWADRLPVIQIEGVVVKGGSRGEARIVAVIERIMSAGARMHVGHGPGVLVD